MTGKEEWVICGQELPLVRMMLLGTQMSQVFIPACLVLNCRSQKPEIMPPKATLIRKNALLEEQLSMWT